jgi:putative addiction module killer protein
MVFELVGTIEYKRWFDALRDERARRNIDARLNRLRGGHFGDCGAVGDGVLELRFHFGPGYRVYFMRQGRVFILLLAGGDKSSRARDIELAKRLAQELWEERSWEL